MRAFIFIWFLSLGFCYALQAQDVFEASRSGNLERLEYLARLKPDTLQARSEGGFTPLIISVYRGQTAVVNFLISKKINLDELSPEGTALMAACYKNDVDMARLLLEHGAKANVRSPEGSSALLFSVLGGNSELVKLLLEHGADPHTRDGNGQTVLSHAEKRQYVKIVELLKRP